MIQFHDGSMGVKQKNDYSRYSTTVLEVLTTKVSWSVEANKDPLINYIWKSMFSRVA